MLIRSAPKSSSNSQRRTLNAAPSPNEADRSAAARMILLFRGSWLKYSTLLISFLSIRPATRPYLVPSISRSHWPKAWSCVLLRRADPDGLRGPHAFDHVRHPAGVLVDHLEIGGAAQDGAIGLDDQHRRFGRVHPRRDDEGAVWHRDDGACAPARRALRVAGNPRGGRLVGGRERALRVE